MLVLQRNCYCCVAMCCASTISPDRRCCPSRVIEVQVNESTSMTVLMRLSRLRSKA